MKTKMNRFGFFLLIGLVLIALSACVGLSQIQDSMSHFAQATHAASAAEATFLNAVLTVDCEKQFHTIAYQYSTDNR